MLEVLLPTLLIILSFIAYQTWRWNNRRFLELSRIMPGPPTIPIIGNGLVLKGSQEDQLSLMQNLMLKYGEYVRLWLGPDFNVFLTNPTDIRKILTSNDAANKGPVYDMMVPVIGPGILTGGPTWRYHRKITNPTYNKKSVKNYSTIFHNEVRDLVNVFKTKDPSKATNIFPDVLRCTTQSVCQTLLGLSKSDSENLLKLKETIEKTQRMYNLTFKRMTYWWYQIPLIYRLLGEQTEWQNNIKDFHEMATDVLNRRKKFLKENGPVADDMRGVVDRYLMSNDVTDQEIIMELFTAFTTSQEALAKLSSGILLFLAHLPEWQKKVYDEIVEVFGSEEEINITEKHVKRLVNLDMVFKEALRLLPVAALIQRKLTGDITINNGKYTLPAGTSIIIPLYCLHRNPNYWENPNKIDPSRFSPENLKNRDPNTFVPFSLGQMDCLGRIFATSIIKTLIVHIIRNFQLEADGNLEDMKLFVAISVKYTEGYNIRAIPRRMPTEKESTA